ncbi:CBN-PTR-9 protein [Caenorhabditis brenneri]|uniref:CBN-PTR-9 protein n=1 Tax=Caenorhabditis brenneri TaxID=135651 RepID=G0MJW4_CAEBE|nr:CBN-PTR-9 protein [Caenorhabditis brenneri]
MKSLNFQSVVSQFFEYESTVVVRWPLPFIIIPPLLTVSIVTLTVTNFHLNVTNDTLQVFLPDDMRSLRDLKELLHLFPPRDAQRDTYSIFGSKFVYTVIEDENSEGNILSSSGIQRMARLHKFVMGLETRHGDNVASNCLRNRDDEACTIHPIAFALEDDMPEFAIQFLLRYPNLKFGDFVVDNAMVFGGVKLEPKSHDADGNSPIKSSKAVRMTYILESSESTERWIDLFLTAIPRYKESNSTILWSSSKSLAKEMERNGELLIPWMPWTSLVLVIFCMFACSSFQVVKSQPFIGFFAMFNATMATVASTSLLIYLQYPFLPLVFIMPFLVVSIGTDNMFLMLKSWRMTKKSTNEEKRYIYALTESAASLFLTSLTDGLSFAIGSISDFHAVRVFCTYCAMAILFMFLFQVTFFNAVMSLCCRREVAGKHPVFCCYDIVPSNETKTIKAHPDHNYDVASIVAKYLFKILNPWPSRIGVFIIFLIYLFTAIHYAIGLPLGLDLKLLAPDDSYVSKELEAQERLFADYGGFCFALIRAENITLRDPLTRRDLMRLYRELGGSEYSSPAEFWLEPFEKSRRGRKYSESDFSDELHTFLAKEPNLKFRNDIRFTMSGRIEAIKMMFRVRKLGKDNDLPRAEYMRKVMESSEFSGFVYDTSFLLVDQQMTTVYNVIIDVVSAILTMLSICVLMKCLLVMTEPILQSALSTAIGVSLLSFVHSYIVRTFVNTVFFVVGLGILHGLIFLPVLLDTIVPESEYMVAYEPHHEEEEEGNHNHYEDLYGL